MLIDYLLNNPFHLRILLWSIAVAAGLAAFILHRVRRNIGLTRQAPQANPTVEAAPAPIVQPSDWTPSFHEAPPLSATLVRGGLIVLAVIVAAGFLMVLLPEGTFNSIADRFRATRAAEFPTEKIALLYLGDEVKGQQFHVRGVIRNISREPLEKLGATIQLYGQDGTLLETVAVKMHLDLIAPDATSEFHLAYPNYTGQFGSYSVDFALGQSAAIPYRDWRGARPLN